MSIVFGVLGVGMLLLANRVKHGALTTAGVGLLALAVLFAFGRDFGLPLFVGGAIAAVVYFVRALRRDSGRSMLLSVAAGALAIFGMFSLPAVEGDAGPPARFGLSASRVENECLARARNQLVSPSSMRFLGNPVGARAIWDPADNEWRWIMDVSAVNAFNVRMEQRFQCIVRPGPTYIIR